MKPADLEEWQALIILHCAPRPQACVFAAGHREPSMMSKSKLPNVKSASLAKSASSRPLREWWQRLSFDLHTHPHMHVSNNDNHLIIYSYLNVGRYQLFPIQWFPPTPKDWLIQHLISFHLESFWLNKQSRFRTFKQWAPKTVIWTSLGREVLPR